MTSSAKQYWIQQLSSIKGNPENAQNQLRTIPELAEKRCNFRSEQMDALVSYLHPLENDLERLTRWDALRQIFFGPNPELLFDAPLPDEIIPDKDHGAFLLTLALAGITYGEDLFRQQNLDISILNEALHDIRIWTDYYQKNYGKLGLDYENGFAWTVLRILRAKVLRFGRLEYNMSHAFNDILVFKNKQTGRQKIFMNGFGEWNEQGNCACPGEAVAFRTKPMLGIFGTLIGYPIRRDGTVSADTEAVNTEEWECILRPLDETVYIHIPADGPMSPEDVSDSLSRMKAFFMKRHSKALPKAVICGSWLLDPVLQKILPETSNLCRFQKLGWLLPAAGLENDMVQRVFGVKAAREGIRSVPWSTTLQKSLGKYLLRHQTAGSGRILLFWDEIS